MLGQVRTLPTLSSRGLNDTKMDAHAILKITHLGFKEFIVIVPTIPNSRSGPFRPLVKGRRIPVAP